MKRIFALLLALLMVFATVSCSGKKNKTPQTPAENLPNAEISQEDTSEKGIKNVIFLIADGGGYALYDFANDVKTAGGLDAKKYPNKTETDSQPMVMRDYLAGSIITLNCNGAVTDSAAAGTALSTGYKTINGYVGVDKAGMPRATILEAAQTMGKATGLVATYEWMHATPAAFSSHVLARDDYKNIYEQIENQNIDVVLGSGYGAVKSYATIDNAVERGYTVITNRDDLEKVKPGDRLWGNATNNSSPYDINLTAEQPTLAQMTKAAITALSGDEDGFFLMVEGSKVDSGGHSNDALVTTSEYLAFDAAFKVALDFAKGRTDTVVIAAPDHDTGAMLYDEIADLDLAVSSVRSGINPATIGWETTSHSARHGGAWIYVPEGTDFAEGLNPDVGDTPETREGFVVENTVLSPYIASLFGVDLDEVTKELFVDVTDIGRYSVGAGKFSFNNGDKYIYRNSSVYYKDGKEVSLDGKVAVEVAGRFYVPAEMVDENDWNYVSEEGSGEISGSGTVEDPYIIDEAWDFIEFTGQLALGETYEGKYFLQTKDIDLSNSSDFTGSGMSQTFAGIYDGDGKTIKIDLNVKKDECVFPKVTGVIMNVNTEGKIKSAGEVNWAYTGGVARTIAAEGKVVNCSSAVEISGLNVGGIAGANNGTMINCYFGGTVEGTNKTCALAANSYNGVFELCYYSSECMAKQEDEGAIEVLGEPETLVLALNEGRTVCAEKLGVHSDELSLWKLSEDGKNAAVYLPEPTITAVIVTPSEAVVNKGEGIMLSAVVEGEYGPSQNVVWSLESSAGESSSVVYEDGFLYVDVNETAESFTVMAKSAVDGSISGICKINVGDVIVSEPDGSRARPYLINNEQDFLGFTNVIASGKNLSGLHFRQMNDLDMSNVDGYNGIQSGSSFAGIYDGNGYTINLSIDSDDDNSLFGSCSGKIMNVRTTGKVNGGTMPAGICRAVRGNGVVVNCISDCEMTSLSEASGIVRSNYNVVANCFFTGTLSASSKYLTCYIQPDGRVYNNHALDEQSYHNGIETAVSADDYSDESLVGKMNEGRIKAGEMAQVPVSLLKEWTRNENGDFDFVR